MRTLLACLIALSVSGAATAADLDAIQFAPLIEEPIRIPSTVPLLAGGSQTFMLEALVVRPAVEGPLPLALFTHGTPRNGEDRQKFHATNYARVARDFARRGWVAAVVIRRGFGTSDGQFAEGIRCADPDYIRAGRIATYDVENTMRFLAAQPYVDATRVLGIGQSTGGFAWLTVSSHKPANLVGVINLAGGHGSLRPHENCNEEHMVSAMREFGSTSRVPTLWLYSENDGYVGPDFARRMHAAFTAAGGNADLKTLPPYGSDGHELFLRADASYLWTPLVDEFLTRLSLPTWARTEAHSELLPTAFDKRVHYERYLAASAEKAFAVSADGHFDWWTSGHATVEEAKQQAMAKCEAGVRKCRVFAVNFAPLPRE